RDHSQNALVMDGQDIFKKAVSHMAAAATEVLEKAGMTVADVDLVVPHQANQRIMEAVARRLRLSDTQLFSNIESYGNTSAASIPLALDEAIGTGRVQSGAIVLLVAFGGGLSWGAVLMKWGDRVEPIGTSGAELDATDQDVFSLLADNFNYFGGGPRRD
ncbi:MAG: 3-oxoacyl-ACP synthase, partial [Acidimicrobiia bacterium]|nr:3-oxoacyl-ACP synthase [Acidimicrobiia bacterium]